MDAKVNSERHTEVMGGLETSRRLEETASHDHAIQNAEVMRAISNVRKQVVTTSAQQSTLMVTMAGMWPREPLSSLSTRTSQVHDSTTPIINQRYNVSDYLIILHVCVPGELDRCGAEDQTLSNPTDLSPDFTPDQRCLDLRGSHSGATRRFLGTSSYNVWIGSQKR